MKGTVTHQHPHYVVNTRPRNSPTKTEYSQINSPGGGVFFRVAL